LSIGLHVTVECEQFRILQIRTSLSKNILKEILHTVASTAMYDTSIAGCTVRHDGDNLSDHDPIMLTLNIDWNSIALTKWNTVRAA